MRVLDFGRPVGTDHPPFIIASLDCRELGTLARALSALDAAAASSVDAIKFSRMPWEWSTHLFERAELRGVAMLATALDESQVERLDWLGAPAFYLVFDWSDLDLVARAARTGKPLVVQVGTATQAELAELIATARANGTGGIALVQSAIDVDLDGLDELARLGAVLGVQDRSACSKISTAAIERGASIVEKRFSPREGEPLSADEVSQVVRDCEETWAALNDDYRYTTN